MDRARLTRASGFLAGYCLRMGEPGSWKGSGGKVVELMSAQAPPVDARSLERGSVFSWLIGHFSSVYVDRFFEWVMVVVGKHFTFLLIVV